MAEIYLSFGSNMGDRKKNITQATVLCSGLMGKIIALSKIYETQPWGFESDHPFMNSVALLQTSQPAEVCLKMVNAIEREMGRMRLNDGQYHDRPIDIDILLYDNEIIETPTLKVPHPLMTQRDFVLQPMAEIAPERRHPQNGKTMKELWEALEIGETEK